MNEIMSLMNRDISGWMCSGDDEAVTAIVFKNLLYKAAEQHFVQVVIASEDMLPAVSQIVESDSRNKGYLPSYAHRYFPAFSGSDVDMKERMVEILKRCRVDQEKADDVMAYIDFLTELFRQAKAAGVHTTLDTSANPYTEKEPFYSKWLELMKYTDLVLLDIKQIDEEEHIKLTGQSNKNILAMARKLSDMGKPMWIRHVLVPGGSDKDEYLHRLADFIHTLKTVERVEVLPYHTLGVFKWEQLGIPYPLEGVRPPSEERINNAREILGAI